MSQLEYGEPLSLIEVTKDTILVYFYGYDYENSWIKVKRNSTNQVGYVFGKYIKPRNAAYLSGQDCDRIQSGYWYGITDMDRKYKLERCMPQIDTVFATADGNHYWTIIRDTSEKYDIIICSQAQLIEGKRDKIIPKNGIPLRNDEGVKVLKNANISYSIICTDGPRDSTSLLKENKPRIILQRVEIRPEGNVYNEQDLTNFFIQYGMSISLIMSADINLDGVPDLIFSEANNRSGTIYYFISNSEGVLELQSMTWGYSKC